YLDIGEQTVKNIAKPVRVYRIGVRETAGDILSITAVETFAANWLAPRLGSFQSVHPNISLRLDATGRIVDFAREECDVGIRIGRGSWPGLKAHELLPIEFTPLCSPEFLARVGNLVSPIDLLELPLLDPQDAWWREWFALSGIT